MLLGFVMDWVWAKYTVSMTEGRPFVAANYSFLIYLFGLFYTMMIVAGKFELVAGYLVGGYAGTYFAVKRKK